MGYHGIPWGSMGIHSKTREIPDLAMVFPQRFLEEEQNTITALEHSFWQDNAAKKCSFSVLTLPRAKPDPMRNARRPVSRVLSRPVSGPGMAIPLGRPLPDASRDLPGRRRRKRASTAPVPEDRPAGRPYAVLLPVGFTLPPPSPAARCALTAPFHPCRRRSRRARRRYGFCGTSPWGRPRRALPGTVFPWSPDFPPPGQGRRAAIRPSGCP